MNTLEFKKQLKTLNSQQKEAVETIEGPVMVIAGPGTGKTQILTLRIANILLKTDASPENILALTFTESAAANMRRRLVDIIGSTGYYINISTFHGFCNKIIQEYPEHFPHIIGSAAATPVDQISAVRKIIETTSLKILKPWGDKFFYVSDILKAVRELKNESISHTDFKKIVAQQKKEFSKKSSIYHTAGPHCGKIKSCFQKQLKYIEKNLELAIIYKKYQQELRSKKIYDFEDMILETVSIFRAKPEFLLEIQEKYHYILIDEHQDTNGAQNKALELLCNFHANPNIFVVGDEKQAIFRFQGASLENFLYFKNKYPQVKLINLAHNYRSTQSILDASKSLIENNKATLVSKLKSQKKSAGEKIKIYSFAHYEAEYLFIAEKIKELTAKTGNKIPLQEIAVLFRENKDADNIADFLIKANIPFVIESDANILDDIEIKKINLLLEAIENFGNDEYLVKALHIDFLNIDPLIIYNLIPKKIKANCSLYTIIRNQKNLSDIYNNLAYWNKLSHNQNFPCFFETVIKQSGFLNHLLKQPNHIEHIEKLNTLFGEIKKIASARNDFSLKDYNEYLNILKNHNVPIRNKAVRQIDAIRLMTAHKAKGLEFDAVFIIGAYNGHWGNRYNRNRFQLPLSNNTDYSELERNEDERRLFYMALTRARKKVFVTYALNSADGKQQVPSQFLGEIKSAQKQEFSGTPHDAKILNCPSLIMAPLQKSPDNRRKKLVTALFDRRGLSPTALNNYLECPWKYFYNSLLRLPKTKNNFQIYGTAMHDSLQKFFDDLAQNKKVGSKSLVDKFVFGLKNQPINGNDFKILIAKGTKNLNAYHDFYKNTWHRQTINEFKISGVNLNIKPGQNIRLIGKLDKLEIQSLKTSSAVTVVDYKTKQPQSRNWIMGQTKDSNGDYFRQLVFYKLLLDLMPKSKYRITAGAIDFIEPNERGIFKKEIFEITDNQTEELKATITKVAREILDLSFWEKGCGKKECEYCELRKLLPDKNMPTQSQVI